MGAQDACKHITWFGGEKDSDITQSQCAVVRWEGLSETSSRCRGLPGVEEHFDGLMLTFASIIVCLSVADSKTTYVGVFESRFVE